MDQPQLLRLCTVCQESQTPTAFNRDVTTRDGLRPECRDCRRKSRKAYKARPGYLSYRTEDHWLRTYGLSSEQIAWLRAKQGNACPGCKEPLQPGRATHVDHCHATGRVRGLLCNGCNSALGSVRDDPKRLRALADYLEMSPAEELGVFIPGMDDGF
jgi:hypothetical protein